MFTWASHANFSNQVHVRRGSQWVLHKGRFPKAPLPSQPRGAETHEVVFLRMELPQGHWGTDASDMPAWSPQLYLLSPAEREQADLVLWLAGDGFWAFLPFRTDAFWPFLIIGTEKDLTNSHLMLAEQNFKCQQVGRETFEGKENPEVTLA